MERRNLLGSIALLSAAWSTRAWADAPGGIYRIGTLNAGPLIADNSPHGAAFLRGLSRYGYIPGKNIAFERRGADLQAKRLPELVQALAADKVDVIVTGGFPPAIAAKQATTLPVVAIFSGDPVGTGLVDSLARPGGNITGISDVSAEVTPKRLELLKEFAPALRKVAVLWNADDLGMTLRYRASEAGARALGIGVQALGVREPEDFDQAFAAMTNDKPDAILMVADALTTLNRKRVIEFAAAHRLPAIYEFDFIARDGGLMSYGPDLDESWGRVAGLVDRILKGAKPAELPFEEPRLFRFVLNLKTAKSLGLNVPQSMSMRADEVIE